MNIMKKGFIQLGKLLSLNASRLFLLSALSLYSWQAHADWSRYETTNFTLYSEKNEEASLQFLKQLERYRQFLIEVAGLTPRPDSLKLTVYFAKNSRSYQDITRSKGSLGLFSNSEDGPISVFYDEKKPGLFKIDGEQVLRHEYVHFLQFQSVPAPYPFWYQEGFAEYLSSVKYRDGAMWVGEILMARAAALHVNDWIYIRKLVEGDRREWGKGYSIYGQSWLLTHMLYTHEKYRSGRSALLKMLADGTEPREAFETAFGVNYQTLDTDLRDYYKAGKFYSYKFIIDEPDFEAHGPVALSKPEQEIATLRAKLALSRSKKPAKRLVRTVRKALKRDPENSALHEIMLKAWTNADDWPGAAEQAKKSLAIPGLSAAAKAVAGEVLWQAEYERLLDLNKDKIDEDSNAEPDLGFEKEFLQKVRGYLEEGIKADPNNARARMWHAGTYIYGGQNNFSAAEDSIKQAYVLYPQSWTIRRQYADLLYTQESYAQACRLYGPLFRTTRSKRERSNIKERLQGLAPNHPECAIRELEKAEEET